MLGAQKYYGHNVVAGEVVDSAWNTAVSVFGRMVCSVEWYKVSALCLHNAGRLKLVNISLANTKFL